MNAIHARSLRAGLITLALVMLGGCATHYIAPGRGADLREVSVQARDTDPALPGLSPGSITTKLARLPKATFPVSIAVVRVQEPGYHSATANSWGTGAYSVITTRDVETDEQFARVRKLEGVAGLATLNRLLLPRQLKSDVELRDAAASMQAQMVLLYTFDTTFHSDDVLEPLTIVTLGLSPTKVANVTSTASALLLDTQTGYVYGAAETTSRVQQLASAWTDDAALDQARLRAEREVFEKLVTELEHAWPTLVERFGPQAAKR